jgi:hypothetical protein
MKKSKKIQISGGLVPDPPFWGFGPQTTFWAISRQKIDTRKWLWARWNRVGKVNLMKLKKINFLNFLGFGARLPYLGNLGQNHIF